MGKPPAANKYPGLCIRCGQTVPEGHGYRTKNGSGQWKVSHHWLRVISPTGPWDKWEAYATDGCPGEAERENESIKARARQAKTGTVTQ